MMVKLSKATTEKEVDAIISEHSQIEMSDTEKQQYSDNVIADLENVLKALDSDIEELRATRSRKDGRLRPSHFLCIHRKELFRQIIFLASSTAKRQHSKRKKKHISTKKKYCNFSRH